jgi:LmbE family N-acetylglucosaminyl deacetylase
MPLANTPILNALVWLGLALIFVLQAPPVFAAGQLQIVAHEDDDLYFMTPAVPDGIATGEASWTVFLTAGDAGRTNGHWQSRELGIRAAYALMAGVPNVWSSLPVLVEGHSLSAYFLAGAPQVVVVFMRLPDGNGSGTGYASTGFESLRYLWELTPGTLIHSVDGAHQYTRSELVDVLISIIRARDPEVLRIQDMTNYHGSDHSDHYHSGRFAFQAHLESGHRHRLRAYRAYNIAGEPVNLSPDEISESDAIITVYGAFDSGVGPRDWNQREIPIADVRETQASLVLMSPGLSDVCLTARNVGTLSETVDFEACADIPEQAFFLTERDIRHGDHCLMSPAMGGVVGSVGFAPCGIGSGQGWTFFTDGHVRGRDDQCLALFPALPVPGVESCTGLSRVWEVGAKPAFDAAMGMELSAVEFGADPARYESLEFGDLDGDGLEDVCVRRTDGIYCALAIGDGLFAAASLWHENYGDDDSWALLHYSPTIALGDLDGDGLTDLCGRGALGLYCVRSNGTSFFDFRLWTTTFSNADGGTSPETYGSLRLGDVDGDGRDDVCGVRGGEVQCLSSFGTDFGSPTTWMTQDWIGLLGLPTAQVGQSLMLGDVDGDGAEDLCERGAAGVYCALADPGQSAFVDPALRSQGEFSDALGWSGAESYWGSIRLGDFSGDGRADLCGRGGAGILCLYSIGGRFSALNHQLSPDFSNAAGFLPTDLGSTLSLADVDGDGRSDLCAAGPTALRCAVLDDPLGAPEPGIPIGLGLGIIALARLQGLRKSHKDRGPKKPSV